MEERHFPYPVARRPYVTLTEDEKTKIVAALSAGWKEFCEHRHDILGQKAKMLVEHAAWQALSPEEKVDLLGSNSVKVPVSLVTSGWPYHGVKAKLTKFRGQLTRSHYAVLTSGIPADRQKQILKQLKVVQVLDDQFLEDAKRVGSQISSLMYNDAPKSAADLISKLDTMLDEEYYVAKHMELVCDKANPTWEEFVAKHVVDME